jgi:Uma2 family endonuclease
MSDSYKIENNAIAGEDDIGSMNHSLAQARLTSLLDNDERFTIMTELSLDISQHDLSKYRLDAKDELKPDVCAYLKPPVIPYEEDDLITVSQMPELAIEVLSPRQAHSYLIRKIKAYFELGVKSCWLVILDVKTVYVYSQPTEYRTFTKDDTELIDEVMNIRLPIAKVFRLPFM